MTSATTGATTGAAGPAGPAGQTEASSRPRVEGDREQQIFDATLAVLADAGYDRLTMDAVAARARASKATLYRRWNGKVSLVIEALESTKGPEEVPDTGSLRGDLIASYCGLGGLTDAHSVATFASVLTAIARDADFAEAFREHVARHKLAPVRAAFERARTRGELAAGVDVDLLGPALAGIVLHRLFLLGEHPDEAQIARIVDQIILPAATAAPTGGHAAPPRPGSPRHEGTTHD